MTKPEDDSAEGAARQPTQRQILDALQKSGYLFEHEVASVIGDLGYHVETSWAFEDPEEQKSREIDIRAVKRVFYDATARTTVFIELLVECKDAASPYVFLQREKNKREFELSPLEYTFPLSKFDVPIGGKSYREVPPFQAFGLGKVHYYYREGLKATQFAKIVRKGSVWQANHDGVYDSLILPLAKAVRQSLKTYTPSGAGSDSFAQIWLRFPIVVLRDHLFAHDLSANEPELRKADRVSFLRHIESGALNGHFLTDFVTRAGLPRYLTEDVFTFADAVVEIARTQRDVLIKRAWSGPQLHLEM